MGVTGLWTVVQPCARPTNISTLNRKRLAVDASIWIYQFLKAVRDKEGNALRNSHVVGFFRRICKLLFHGVHPVFVFDGGAPALKRATVAARKSRREGRREDAIRTAGKLLAVQMQRRAEEDEQKRREEAMGVPDQTQQEELPQNLVYVDQLEMTPQQRAKNQTFKKKDQYHLPDLDVSLSEMGAPNDPRIMSLEELENYARQFDRGEDINVYDFSKIDFDSPFFMSLPASDRYNILNAARLRSRLRMGYSKEQLDIMFPNRMEFSRFQIERVRERNELTQRLMNINGMNGEEWNSSVGRIAGEKGREYVLVKNDGVEGGWALGVVINKDEGQRNKPIDVDRPDRRPLHENEEDADEQDEDDDFEDVPIEGLNRLPKRHDAVHSNRVADDLSSRRHKVYAQRQAGTKSNLGKRSRPAASQADSLFVAEKSEDEEQGDEEAMEDRSEGLREASYDEEDELQRAIALSLESDHIVRDTENGPAMNTLHDGDDKDDFEEVFNKQVRVDDAKPFSRGSALAIARTANARSSKAIVTARHDSDEDDDIDLQAALAASRAPKKIDTTMQTPPRKEALAPPISNVEKKSPRKFDGPLPFEALDLGSSFLGRKKQQPKVEAEGGFIKADDKPKRKAEVIHPPWFSVEAEKGLSEQKRTEKGFRDLDKKHDEQFHFETLKPKEQDMVIVVDDEEARSPNAGPIEISDDEKDCDEALGKSTNDPNGQSVVLGTPSEDVTTDHNQAKAKGKTSINNTTEPTQSAKNTAVKTQQSTPQTTHPSKAPFQAADSDSSDEEFEDVPIQKSAPLRESDTTQQSLEVSVETSREPLPIEHITGAQAPQEPTSEAVQDPAQADPDLFVADMEVEAAAEPDDIYSDPEDEDLFKQLANEAEEHARFASTFNNKSSAQNAADYERELRQLRSQQKRDRRDADEVTQTMIAECQQLLSLFGLPYISAPMEAEAQCAELVRLGLVDGIVTDDSDIFLFGGTRVYKNMFNQAKFVECYLTSDLEAEFSLTRDKLIAIAQLLGSDYTEGLPGVGPITALEIISEFGTLEAFKAWWDAVQNGSRSKAEDAAIPFRRKFRKNSTKLFLPATFPDPRVADAYLHPEVDHDPTAFVWGIPDLNALREFLMATIGWSQERTDEILVPVIRDMNKREQEGTQSNITRFFGGTVGAGAFAPRQRAQGSSKRLASALTKMALKEKERSASNLEVDAEREEHEKEQAQEQEEPVQPAKRRRRAKA